MVKNNLTKLEKRILAIEIVFVLTVLIYIFFATAPNQIYPLHGMTITEANFNIEILNGEEVLISGNNEFTNPIVLRENSEIDLFPGVYYWKVRGGFRESEIQNFTIKSHVGLEIKERKENYELENSGNVDLNITREKEGITSSIVLNKGEFKEVKKDDSNYKGEEI